MKMAQLLDKDFSLLGVFSRMGLDFGFSEASVDEVCRRSGTDTDTFLLICSVYAVPGFRPSADDRVDLKEIVKYLHLSHSYYMDQVLPRLAQALERMTAGCQSKPRSVIRSFFSQYKEELSKHFAYEEDYVFPYVNAVLEGRSGEGFSIAEYERNHSNVEEKLEDLKNLVMKYLPQGCDQSQAMLALVNIYTLEYDLEKHTIIEDEVLVPGVGRIENA